MRPWMLLTMAAGVLLALSFLQGVEPPSEAQRACLAWYDPDSPAYLRCARLYRPGDDPTALAGRSADSW